MVPMATTNLFTRPGLQGRRVHRQRPRGARLRAAEDDARDGPGRRAGRARSTSSGAAARAPRPTPPRRPSTRIKRFREAINFLCDYAHRPGLRHALRARAQAQRAARRHLLRRPSATCSRFIPTLDHPEMVGVNPEVAHEHDGRPELRPRRRARRSRRASCSTSTSTTRSSGRYDQDFRFGAGRPQGRVLPRQAAGGRPATTGPRHFDAHAYRTEDEEGVWDFARGCMRTYLMLKERAWRSWAGDADIAAAEAGREGAGAGARHDRRPTPRSAPTSCWPRPTTSTRSARASAETSGSTSSPST